VIQEVRKIHLEGVRNTRDLGGYRTGDGRRIKPCHLIRSGQLHDLTERDKEILTRDYSLAVIVDFRTHAEKEENPDPDIHGVAYIHNPILEEKTLGITREKEADNDVVSMVLNGLGDGKEAGVDYMKKIYGNLLTNTFSIKQYSNFFQILLKQETGAVLWHCTAGKDRAGTGTALVLEALGVPREQIIADYLKVNEFLAEEINQSVRELVEKTGNVQLGEQLRMLFSVQEEYIQTIFGMIDQEYGGIERFMKEEMGLAEDFRDALRGKYLTGKI
jgi:Protein tyrosine/serine phosphatase